MNVLTSENIEKQLFFLAKENIKYLVLNSKCGITIPISELKPKNIPNFDINTISSFSPLICIYKKANPKLINISGNLCFEEDALKKEIIIESNALMSLSILELIDYYKKFKEIDTIKHSLSTLYLLLAKKQLEFYASNFRNIEGVFIDKKHVSHNLSDDYKFEEKNKRFKYSDQALLMAAFHKYSLHDESKCGNDYRTFSLDILNMLLQYKDDLYSCSYEDLTKLCFALNIFCKDSKITEANLLLLDLMEYLIEISEEDPFIRIDEKLEYDCLIFINCMLVYENTGILKFKDKGDRMYNKLLELYDSDRGIFGKLNEKKEIEYSCQEIVFYLLSVLNQMKLYGKSKDSNMIAVDVFKRQLVNSGIILSWPASPDLDDVERYNNFSSKADDLLDEQEYRMATLPTPESIELPSLFIKYVNYNKKKEVFSQGKVTFETSKNLFIFFLIIFLNKIFGGKLQEATED